MPRIFITVEYDVVETPKGTVEELAEDIRTYLTHPECPLLDDYGLGAWGGYDGAYITEGRVVETRVEGK